MEYIHPIYRKINTELTERELNELFARMAYFTGEIVLGSAEIESNLEVMHQLIQGKLYSSSDIKFANSTFDKKIKCISDIIKNRENTHYLTEDQWEKLEEDLVQIKNWRNRVAHGFTEKTPNSILDEKSLISIRQRMLEVIKELSEIEENFIKNSGPIKFIEIKGIKFKVVNDESDPPVFYPGGKIHVVKKN